MKFILRKPYVIMLVCGPNFGPNFCYIKQPALEAL